MKASRFSAVQKAFILKQAADGMPAAQYGTGWQALNVTVRKW